MSVIPLTPTPGATDWWSVYVVSNWQYSSQSLVVAVIVSAMLWKIQAPNKWPERKLWVAAILNELVGTCLLQPVFGYFVLGRVLPASLVSAPIPDLWTFVWQIFACFVVADGVFYWTHRLLHTPMFYGIAHKQHHEFKQTVGFALTYASPLEALISNIPSTALGPIIFRPHLTVLFVYLVLRYQESAEEHSGYVFPYSPWSLLRSNEHHDFHHSHNVGAYGTFPFWDWLCGTDAAFNAYKLKLKQQKAEAPAANDTDKEKDK